jgi:hypothetical protein
MLPNGMAQRQRRDRRATFSIMLCFWQIAFAQERASRCKPHLLLAYLPADTAKNLMFWMNKPFSFLFDAFTQVNTHYLSSDCFKRVYQRIKADFRWIVLEADDKQAFLWVSVQGRQFYCITNKAYIPGIGMKHVYRPIFGFLPIIAKRSDNLEFNRPLMLNI